MKKYLADYAYLFAIAATIILLDQLTKHLVRTNLPMATVFMPDLWLSQYARIVNWKNTGAAFGMFQSLSTVFTILPFVVSAVIIYYFPQVPRQDWYLRLAMGMLLGGALGNLVDRLTLGYVTDFISIWRFPVFNLADLSITTGVVIMFLGMWLQERQKKTSQSSAIDEGEVPMQEKAAHSLPEELQGE